MPASALRAVRREMARVYKDARAGRIETSEETRLAYVLSVILKPFELERIEERLNRLEARNGNSI